MRICFCFPSRQRAYRFYQTIDNIRENVNSDNYFIWGKIDEDDPQLEKYKLLAPLYPELHIEYGTSRNKVNAINRSMENLPPCDIIIVQADDIVWEVKGFDDEIRNAFKTYYPNLNGTIHFPEQHAGQKTSVVSMLGINLYKQLGYIYFEDYHNVYCDNDFTEMTRMMGVYAFVNKRIFGHYHPIFKMTPWDSQYKANEAPENYARDREIYIKRKSINFGL